MTRPTVTPPIFSVRHVETLPRQPLRQPLKRMNSPTFAVVAFLVVASVLAEVVHATDIRWRQHPSRSWVWRNTNNSPMLRPPKSLLLNLRGGGSSDPPMDTTATAETSPKKKKRSRPQKRNKSKSKPKSTRTAVREDTTSTTAAAADSSPPTTTTTDSPNSTPHNHHKSSSPPPQDSIIAQIECSILSIGCGMGATDTISITTTSPQIITESSLSTLLLQQYLGSHAGVYGMQCVLSLLTLLAGALVLMTGGLQQLVVVKRTLLFAALKYALGLGGSSPWISSRGIARVGLRETRQRTMEPLVQSSNISQRLWYCLVMGGGWLPTWKKAAADGGGFSLLATKLRLPRPLSSLCSIPFLLVTPVLIQEMAALLLGLVEVLQIAIRKYSQEEEEEGSPHRSSNSSSSSSLLPLLVLTQAILHTSLGMWIGTSPKFFTRHNTPPSVVQRLVARRTNQYATVGEFAVGMYMCADVLQTLSQTLFGGGNVGVLTIFRKLICTKLFVSYCISKMKKKSSPLPPSQY